MPNKTEIECFFRSSDLEELCRKGSDIIINFIADYPPGKQPKIKVTASVYKKETKSIQRKSAVAALKILPADGTVNGCPNPCK